MSIITRSQIVQPGDTINLRSKWTDSDGYAVDLDTSPSITIIQPSGGVVLGPVSSGVSRIGTGEYQYSYDVGLFPAIGTWVDVWRGAVDGFNVYGEFNFTVFTSQVQAIGTDGYCHLGDDVGYNYSQVAIHNINTVLKSVKMRLKSSGKRLTKDAYGNDIYKDCDIYSVDELVSFVARSMSMFNEIPHFTNFTYDDTPIVEQFYDLFVQGAYIQALFAQALIERGREFQMTDNGTGFTPPTVSELLTSQASTELTNYTEKTKQVKANCKPSSLGLGSMSFTNGASSAVRRLRTLRARQIF